MTKQQFVDVDLKGRRIESRPKETRSTEVEGHSRFCGHRFILRSKTYGDKRCLYCGKWFHWQSREADVKRWIATDNLDNLNVDNNIEPLHCESSHCEEYHQQCKKAQENRAKEYRQNLDDHFLKVYKNLKRKKLL